MYNRSKDKDFFVSPHIQSHLIISRVLLHQTDLLSSYKFKVCVHVSASTSTSTKYYIYIV